MSAVHPIAATEEPPKFQNRELEFIDWFGNKGLHHVFAKSDPDANLTARVLEHDAELAKSRNQFGRIPLHYCLDHGTPSIYCVRLLVKYYPAGVFEDDNDGISPYDLALKWEHRDEILLALLEVRPQVDYRRYVRLKYGRICSSLYNAYYFVKYDNCTIKTSAVELKKSKRMREGERSANENENELQERLDPIEENEIEDELAGDVNECLDYNRTDDSPKTESPNSMYRDPSTPQLIIPPPVHNKSIVHDDSGLTNIQTIPSIKSFWNENQLHSPTSMPSVEGAYWSKTTPKLNSNGNVNAKNNDYVFVEDNHEEDSKSDGGDDELKRNIVMLGQNAIDDVTPIGTSFQSEQMSSSSLQPVE
jgi:hypothetical protein